MFKLDQATAEGWTITGEPLAIVSVDQTKSDLTQRSHVFNQIMAGSAYHAEAFDIVRTQNAGAIARVPVVTPGQPVKLTKAMTIQVDVEIPAVTEVRPTDYGEDEVIETEPARTEVQDRVMPVGTIAEVTTLVENGFTIRFQNGVETTFTTADEVWFPVELIDVFHITGNYGILTADKATGAVLAYRPNGEDGTYEDIALVDVAELRSTFGAVPDAIDIILVGYTGKDGRLTRPDRQAWLADRLQDPELVDTTTAQVVIAELTAAGRWPA